MQIINEDVNKSNKIVKEIESTNIDPLEIIKIKEVVRRLKEYLVKNNSVGYLGPFTQILYSMVDVMYSLRRSIRRFDLGDNRLVPVGWYFRSLYGERRQERNDPFELHGPSLLIDFMRCHKRIKENRDIISNLRDKEGRLIKIEECDSLHSLNDFLDDLNRWRKFNNFLKYFPKTQKDLIWENGYFKDIRVRKRTYRGNGNNTHKVVNLIEYRNELYNSVDVIFDKKREDIFLKKVSSLKTPDELFRSILNMGNTGLIWDIDSYIFKIEVDKDVDIIYNKDKILVVKMTSAIPVVKYCSDTSWCIKEPSTFRSHHRNADFFVIFNFNLDEDSYNSKIGITATSTFGVIKILDFMDRRDRPLANRISELKMGLSVLTDLKKYLYPKKTDKPGYKDGIKSTTLWKKPGHEPKEVPKADKEETPGMFNRIKRWLDF